jgi:hypothetical protein
MNSGFQVSAWLGAIDVLPPMPGSGRCICGRVPFFVRSGLIGHPGHFWCRHCGRRYKFATVMWAPGADTSLPVTDHARGEAPFFPGT